MIGCITPTAIEAAHFGAVEPTLKAIIGANAEDQRALLRQGKPCVSVGGLIASAEILAGDFDADGDIDGTNLATLADNPSLLDLLTFATTFGKTSGTFKYFYDGNGNVGQLVRADYEAIAAHYEYDPYGNTILATGDMAGANPYRFSTKSIDPLSLTYQDEEFTVS